MWIDHYLPRYDVRAQYGIDIQAPLSRVYEAARTLDLRASWIARGLFRLRGLPEANLTLEGMKKWGFVVLAEDAEREIVLGLIGHFWTRSPQIQSLPPEDFIGYNQPGLAKAVMNLAFLSGADGIVRLTTETRVHCLGEASRRSFQRYWLLIGPFSGLVRKEWLRLIKQRSSL